MRHCKFAIKMMLITVLPLPNKSLSLNWTVKSSESKMVQVRVIIYPMRDLCFNGQDIREKAPPSRKMAVSCILRVSDYLLIHSQWVSLWIQGFNFDLNGAFWCFSLIDSRNFTSIVTAHSSQGVDTPVEKQENGATINSRRYSTPSSVSQQKPQEQEESNQFRKSLEQEGKKIK